MSRVNPPFLSVGALPGRVYIVTRYTQRADGTIVASEKFDVTTEFDRIAAERAATVPEPSVGVDVRGTEGFIPHDSNCAVCADIRADIAKMKEER